MIICMLGCGGDLSAFLICLCCGFWSAWWSCANHKIERVSGCCTTIVEMQHCHPLPAPSVSPPFLSYQPPLQSSALHSELASVCMMSLLIAQDSWVVKLVYTRPLVLFPAPLFLSLSPDFIPLFLVMNPFPPPAFFCMTPGVAECGKSDLDIYGPSFRPSTAFCSLCACLFSPALMKVPQFVKRPLLCINSFCHLSYVQNEKSTQAQRAQNTSVLIKFVSL